jgi:superfamily I DNA/RNA helicase
MGFAGALPDAFDDYTAAFEAQPYALVWNFRSSAELVLLQHVIAVRLDPAAVPAVSKAAVEEGHVPASLWTYPNAAREAAHVAEWIAGDIANSGRAASGFALVARQKVADYEPLLIAELEANGVKLRNDDARYGTSSLQDLLKHDVTRVLLGILKLAAEPNGLGDVWLDVTATMARIRGEDDDVVASRALSDELARSTRDLRSWLASTPPEPAAAAAAVVWAAGIVGLEQLKRYAESRHHGENVDDLYASFTGRLSHVLAGADSWSQAFIDVEAEDAVTLLTIHRSKGLEYHTVLFLGLDEGQWWSYKYDVDEAISAFFVGLSRAAQRLIFTCTDWGAESGEISELYAMLDAAGVKRQTWS